MSTDRVRGGAGIVFAILALFLLKGGPGVSESAASTGCVEDPACYVEITEEGVIGPEGSFVASHTATCKGTCEGPQECQPKATQNSDGSRTWQCSCDWVMNPSACTGVATVDSSGTVKDFNCVGSCDTPPAQCRKQQYNVVTDQNCPKGYSLNRKCVCE